MKDSVDYLHGANGTERIQGVDGLRAIAMIMVIACHCKILPFGWVGVWLFFVISGFVIGSGFIRGDYARSSIARSYAYFIIKRAGRLMPAYMLCLIINIIIIAFIGQPNQTSDLLYLITFTYNWQMIYSFWPGYGGWIAFAHLWTLSIEQQFYILFPFLALLIATKAQNAVIIILIVAGPLVRWVYSIALEQSTSMDPGARAFAVYASTHCHIDAFLLGVFVAKLRSLHYLTKAMSTRVWLVGILVFSVYCISFYIINREEGRIGIEAFKNIISGVLYGERREVFVYVSVNIIAVALLLHVVLKRQGAWFFESPLLVWVGRISYGGYLYHAFILMLTLRFMGVVLEESSGVQRIFVFFTVTLATVTFSYFSFRYLEIPLLKLVSRKSSKPISAGILVGPR